MRDLVYFVATSIDGQIADAGGGFSAFPTEGDHIAAYFEILAARFDTVVMGRKTYEVGLRAAITDPYPGLKTYVISKSLTNAEPKITVIGSDAAGFVSSLKREQGKDIYLCGGSELAASLLRAKLIDEVLVKLNPVAIGRGIPLFGGLAEAVGLELAEHQVYRSGVIFVRYRVKG